MKTRMEQAKTSGMSLIEILALIAIFLIVSASIQFVSNGASRLKSTTSSAAPTNTLRRDFHAPRDVIHSYAPGS